MLKKILLVCLIFSLVISFVAVLGGCASGNDENVRVSQKTTEPEKNETTENQEKTTESILGQGDSTEDIEIEIIEYVEDEIFGLNEEFIELKKRVDTYEVYVENVDEIKDFYEKVNTTSEKISVRLCEYSIIYAEKIIYSDMSTEEMYDAFDDLYECIYEDAADELYDGIYDGLLEDMYDEFYDGVVSDGYDIDNYSDWYDMSSGAYDMWYDTSSDCYDHWFDMQSDVYDFYLDIRSDLFNNDIDDAKAELEDFKKDVEKMKVE